MITEHLGWINRVIDLTCAKHGLRGSDAADFASWVHMKLMENDYALIRNNPGESELNTYLATVVGRQFSEFWRIRSGRWRISATARRLGPPAPELEALVYRDGYRLEQAGEKLRTEGRVTMSDAQLARLLAQLPQREPLRPVEVPPYDVLDVAEAESQADERVLAEEAEQQRWRVMVALDRAMDQLNPEDRLIVRMHFEEGRTLAYVARALNLEQKPLYRRTERLRALLKAAMEREGVSGADVHRMLEDDIVRSDVLSLTQGEQPRDFRYSGIFGPDGLPITQEDLERSRIITDVISTNEKILQMVRADTRSIYNLSSREFEELVAELFHQQGYQVSLTPPSNDGGFDIAAARKDGLGEFLFLVECKRYAENHKVGVEVVRSLYGVVEKEKAAGGIVVTTSYFTKGAETFQRELTRRMSLRNYIHLQQWLGVTIVDPGLGYIP